MIYLAMCEQKPSQETSQPHITTHLTSSGVNPNSSNCSSAASFSFARNFFRASTGNQSSMKLIRAQSTFAMWRTFVSQRLFDIVESVLAYRLVIARLEMGELITPTNAL